MVLRYLVVIFVLYLAFNWLKKLGTNPRQSAKGPRTAPGGEDLVEDPYCHTYIPLSEAYRASLAGKDLFFCSKECLEKYITKGAEQA